MIQAHPGVQPVEGLKIWLIIFSTVGGTTASAVVAIEDLFRKDTNVLNVYRGLP